MNRRNFFAGLTVALAAPAIIRTPGLLMPVKAPRYLVGPNWREIVRLANISSGEHYGRASWMVPDDLVLSPPAHLWLSPVP